jgi:hypothetical protein
MSSKAKSSCETVPLNQELFKAKSMSSIHVSVRLNLDAVEIAYYLFIELINYKILSLNYCLLLYLRPAVLSTFHAQCPLKRKKTVNVSLKATKLCSKS